MPPLQLTREINIPRVEAYLDALLIAPLQDIATHEHIEGASFGGEAALIQLLFTWAKRHPDGQLWLKTTDDNEELVRFLEKFSKRAFGFVAMLMASGVLTGDGRDCRRLAYKACESCVDELVTSVESTAEESEAESSIEDALSKAVYGHRTFLPCVDHSTKAAIAPFYHPNGQFRERSEFRRFAEVLIGRRATRFVDVNLSVLSGLGAILYELMHNTHDWARTEVDATKLRKSIRGILFTHFFISEASIRKAAGNNSEITAYMHQVEIRNPGKTIHFAELSVFDAGPGLAARWLGLEGGVGDLTITSEHDACVSCLGVHRSTSSDMYRGIGLYEVMHTLSQLSAMVRVRTGRLAMLRNFIAEPLLQSERVTGPILPLSSEHEGRPGGLAPVTGTTFTILFPLK